MLVLTTNHRERLDPALIRSGRVDIEISFNHATYEQMETLFPSFYDTTKDNWKHASVFAKNLSELLNKHGKNVSMAQLQHFFILQRKYTAVQAAGSYASILQLIRAKEEVEASAIFTKRRSKNSSSNSSNNSSDD